MEEFARINVEGLKNAVSSGELRRSDLLDDVAEGLIRIVGIPECDSLDRVELIMAIEERYSVSLITVGELLDFLAYGDSDTGAGVLNR